MLQGKFLLPTRTDVEKETRLVVISTRWTMYSCIIEGVRYLDTLLPQIFNLKLWVSLQRRVF